MLGLAALLALAVGAPWYVRNTLEHGWPLWPFARGPTGDPRPAALPDSLLGAPHRTLAGHVGEYLGRLAGGTLLLTAAPAALVARRRGVVLAAAATVVGVLLWAAAPVTGRSADASAAYIALTTLRYLLPTLALGALAVALAAAAPRARHLAALALAGATAWSALRVAALPPDERVATGVIVLAALAGLLTVAVLGRVLSGSAVAAGGVQPRTGALAVAVAAVASVGVLVVGASGWVARHGRSPSAWDAGAATWLAAQPRFHEPRDDVAMAPFAMAALAGGAPPASRGDDSAARALSGPAPPSRARMDRPRAPGARAVPRLPAPDSGGIRRPASVGLVASLPVTSGRAGRDI